MAHDEMLTSGFVVADAFQSVEQEFGFPQEFYTSETGYCQLLLVRRYGRIQLLKTLKPEYRGHEGYECALRKEFQIGFGLEHDHICRTIDWEAVEGLGHCILMEYVDGQTLKALLEQGQLSCEQSRRLVLQLCSALAYLHRKQVIHRDLKPENIMVTHLGQNMKLIDFSLSDSDESAILKHPAGTPFYLAPELRDGTTRADQRSDIYSLGVIMGEMARQTGDRQMKRVATVCTRTSPEKRYQSAEEVAKALSVSYRHRFLFFLAAVVLTVVLGAVLWHVAVPAEQESSVVVSAGHGNVALNSEVLTFVQRQRQLMQQGVEIDTTVVCSNIRQLLDAEFPPEAGGRQHPQYVRQWQAACLLLNHPLKAAP